MRTIALAIALTTVACGGSPTSPTGQAEQFTGTVNGQSFTASSNGRGALRTTSTSTVSMVGANCSSGANLNLMVKNPAVGTFPVSQDVNVQWTPDARTGTAAQEQWQAPGGGGFTVGTGSGNVTITSLTDGWVTGSFNVVVVAGFNNQDKTPKTVTGSFELSFATRTIC